MLTFADAGFGIRPAVSQEALDVFFKISQIMKLIIFCLSNQFIMSIYFKTTIII